MIFSFCVSFASIVHAIGWRGAYDCTPFTNESACDVFVGDKPRSANNRTVAVPTLADALVKVFGDNVTDSGRICFMSQHADASVMNSGLCAPFIWWRDITVILQVCALST
jgi:hypothetical protein